MIITLKVTTKRLKKLLAALDAAASDPEIVNMRDDIVEQAAEASAKSNRVIVEYAGMSNQELAQALNKATGSSLTEADVEDWFGENGVEGEGYNRTDEVVQEYMGEKMYHEMCVVARLPGALMARLQGLDKAVVGGMKLVNLQDGLKGRNGE